MSHPMNSISLPMAVSMKSGLEGRNNQLKDGRLDSMSFGLNEVRPRRPEQLMCPGGFLGERPRLNEVRPRRPEQFRSCDPAGPERPRGLNEVRPRRPEQYLEIWADGDEFILVSMKSGLEGRNNAYRE